MLKNISLLLCIFFCANFSNAAPVSGQGTWETTLHARDLDGDIYTTEAYYDEVLNITWLADANFAVTTGYLPNGEIGLMQWNEAQTWVSDLSINDIDGWRLPAVTYETDEGVSIFDEIDGVRIFDQVYNNGEYSEMASLYYATLGNSELLTNTGLFRNIFPNQTAFNPFWTGTQLEPPTHETVWVFNMKNGTHDYYDHINSTPGYAWAVHDGDVGASSVVPIPSTIWLFGSGLIGLIGIARKKVRV